MATKPKSKKAAAAPVKAKVTKAIDAAPAKVKPAKVAYVPNDQEKYMCKRQLDHFQQMLEKMRGDILANNERLIDAIKDDVQALPDENDRASKESEFTVELRERERERRLLDKIDSATSRIKNKNFGYCHECGERIGLPRLLARPVATLCIECKSLQEAFERSGASLMEDHHLNK